MDIIRGGKKSQMFQIILLAILYFIFGIGVGILIANSF